MNDVEQFVPPTGFRHGAMWTYLVMLLASAGALVVSLVLSAETLVMWRATPA